MTSRYIIKWHEPGNPSYTWWVRGLDADGHFYGEIVNRDPLHRRLTDISGQIPRRRLAALLRLLKKLETASKRQRIDSWTGLLAKGTIAKPKMILKYNPGDEDKSASAKMFLELVELLQLSISEVCQPLNMAV